jgi:hypothetical protein
MGGEEGTDRKTWFQALRDRTDATGSELRDLMRPPFLERVPGHDERFLEAIACFAWRAERWGDPGCPSHLEKGACQLMN